MSEPENIKRFQNVSAQILGTLYATHPVAQWDEASLIYGDDVTDDNEALFSETVEYLYENGYITKPQAGFIRLRDKGYEALNKPNPLNKKQSLGSGLAAWSKGAASDISKDNLSKLASYALQSLFSALSPGS